MSVRALLLALLLPVAGCAALQPAAAPPDGVPEWASVLVLINRAETPILDVYLSACEEDEWGPDRLDAEADMEIQEVVMPGLSRTFVLEPGCWDARVVFRDGREAEERGVDMATHGQRTWTVLESDGARASAQPR